MLGAGSRGCCLLVPAAPCIPHQAAFYGWFVTLSLWEERKPKARWAVWRGCHEYSILSAGEALPSTSLPSNNARPTLAVSGPSGVLRLAISSHQHGLNNKDKITKIMPRGFYLGQGLIPLGYSSSDDDEGPCELPDGRVVCGPHGLVVCGRCCIDYSFMDDVLSNRGNGDDEEEEDDDDEDSGGNGAEPDFIHDLLGPSLRKGTGRSWPSKFIPSSTTDTPAELFSGRRKHIRVTRSVLTPSLSPGQ